MHAGVNRKDSHGSPYDCPTGLSTEERADSAPVLREKLTQVKALPLEGFERLNIACPRATLTAALGRLKEGFLSY